MNKLELNNSNDFFINQLNKNSPLEFELFWNDYCVFYQSNYESPLKELFKDKFHNIVNHRFLKNHLDDIDCNEIIIYSNEYLHLEKNGSLFLQNIPDLSLLDFNNCLNFLTQKNNISWNYSKPFVSFYSKLFNHEVRISLIHFSLTSNSISKLTIRKIKNHNLTIDNFQLTIGHKTNLNQLIEDKKNILISGATSSGKTSFLRCLIEKIPKSEHLIILEDTHEIKTNHFSHTNLLSNEDKPLYELKSLLAYSLRMRPDRIILGEIRSSEVIPFIMAMNTGHNGLMGTIHANSPNEALTRMALLFTLYSENSKISYELILKIICQNIDYVVHLEKRKVKNIIKILGAEEGLPYYEYIT